MGCVSSATSDKYEAPKGSPSPASASRSATSASPKASPKAQSGGGNRVLEENDVATVNFPSGVARVIPMEGLLKDSDGDEAHEFFVEDPKTGEMRRVVSKELKKVP